MRLIFRKKINLGNKGKVLTPLADHRPHAADHNGYFIIL